MIGLVEPAGIGEMRGFEVQRRGLYVHEVDEARPVHDAHRDRFGGVVTGIEQQAVEQFPQGQFFAGADAHVVRFDLGRSLRDRDHGVERRQVGSHQGGHELGQRCLRVPGGGRLLVEDLAGGQIDDDRRPSLDLWSLGDWVRPQPAAAQHGNFDLRQLARDRRRGGRRRGARAGHRPGRDRWMRRWRVCRGGNRLNLVLVLQQAEGAAAEQEHDNDDDRANDGITPPRGGAQTTRRAAPAARPEAVSRRRVRRAPQEVGFMMDKHTRNVKDCPTGRALDR